MKKLLSSILIAGAWLVLPPVANAATPTPAGRIDLSFTGQPHSYAVLGKPYRALGYGEASFGMTVDAVRQQLTRAFPGPAAAVKDETDLLKGNRSLTIVLPQLAPGPGPATISYVFGSRSKCLVAVNIYWLATGIATAAQQDQLTAAAAELVADVLGYQWPALSSVRGHVLPGNSLVVFAGTDAQGGGFEIRLDGVAIDIEPRASAKSERKEHRVPAAGPAQLRMSVVADTVHPDVYRLPPHSF